MYICTLLKIFPMQINFESFQNTVQEIPAFINRNLKQLLMVVSALSIMGLVYLDSKTSDANSNAPIRAFTSPVPTPDPDYADNVIWINMESPDGTSPNLKEGDLVVAKVGVSTNFTVPQVVKVYVDLGYLELADPNFAADEQYTPCDYGSLLVMHYAICKLEIAANSNTELNLPDFKLGTSVRDGDYPVTATVYASPDERDKGNNARTGHYHVGGYQIYFPEIEVH